MRCRETREQTSKPHPNDPVSHHYGNSRVVLGRALKCRGDSGCRDHAGNNGQVKVEICRVVVHLLDFALQVKIEIQLSESS